MRPPERGMLRFESARNTMPIEVKYMLLASDLRCRATLDGQYR